MQQETIPESVKQAANDNEPDEMLLQIRQLEQTIVDKERELRHLSSDLDNLKTTRRSSLKLSHRADATWCLELDKDNPYYFLKTSKGVATCTAIKNHLPEVDADLKSKTASALSWLYLNKEVGRIEHNDTRYYGVKELFIADGEGFYTILKTEFINKVKDLHDVKLKTI